MNPSRDFVHLHVHSHFSLLDGANRIGDIVSAAESCGMPAVALTDHGNMFGAAQFYRECRKRKVKPLIGLEAYVAPGSRHERKREKGTAFYHFLLLARNEEGYRNLIKIASLAYMEGFYYKPRVDKELLSQHSAGIIASSACLSSEINRTAMSGTDEDLEQCVREHRDMFEPGCFFLELQKHGIPEQDRILERVPPIARKLGIPLIATNDIHYLRRDDARAQEVHLCINTGTTLADEDRMQFSSDEFYFRNGAEMERVLGDFPEALTNTRQIADMIDFNMKIGSDREMHLPVFEGEGLKSSEDRERYFKELCLAGARRRYTNFDHDAEIRKRLEYELEVIQSMGFVDYFLIVWDFIRYAREHDIPVGPGRGSAAGSIVAYATEITDIDPLEYDLIFERFLNPKRISMPDIDIDFCMEGRGRVIEYVKSKYGEDRVCQIVTFGTMAARAVLRDVGRVLGIPLPTIDQIAKKIPAGPGIKLKESLEKDPELRKMAREDPKIAELFATSLKLEGLNRHSSTHAAGVVIGDAPLIECLPLAGRGEDLSTQFPMEDLEDCGMLKMDFLGLRTLTIIDRTLDQIRRSSGDTIDVRNLPLDDSLAFELLQSGETVAVFQLESNGMRDLLRRLVPDRFEDIVAILALYRPGPLESGMVDMYIERKHGREPIKYEHKTLEPILRETNGVILYQEQVMRIANVLCGFDLGDADTLRKAMGKKKPEIMVTLEKQFLEGADENGVDAKVAKSIWDNILKFAGYGFNKSHSTAYAYVTYQTAFLKANYQTEFMAGVMTCEMNNVDKIVENLEECKRLKIDVLPPDINRSLQIFSVEDGKIYYGLEAVKGLGGKFVSAAIREREENGPYRSIFEFCERVDLTVLNKSVLESLIHCGAFDVFGRMRSQLGAVLEIALKSGIQTQRDRAQGQADFLGQLFGEGESSEGGDLDSHAYPDLPEWPSFDRLSREKQTLGFYLSGHPLAEWQTMLDRFSTHRIAELQGASADARAIVGVLISKLTARVSRRTGDRFYIAQVEDLTGSTEVFVNQKLYEAHAELLHENSLVFLIGSIRHRDTNVSVSVDSIARIDEGPKQLTEDFSVLLPASCGPEAEDVIFRLKTILESHRGDTPVFLVMRNERGERVVIQVGRDSYVTPELELFRKIEDLLGRDRFEVNQQRSRWAKL